MKNQVLVWDLPTRMCHWSLAACIVYSWYSVEIAENMEWHFWSGYVILTLILFRIIWGFLGTRYARFKAFRFSVHETVKYIKRVKSTGSKIPYLGHNPIGSLSALAMMFAILLQASTGLFNTDDYYFGPLSGLIDKKMGALFSKIHQQNADLLKILIGIHVAAIIFYKFYKNENLTKAMITGKKDTSATQRADNGVTATDSKNLLALVVFAFSSAVVYGLVNFFSQTLATNELEFLY